MFLIKRRTILIITCAFGAACLLASMVMPSLMKVPSRSERSRASAIQGLKSFYHYVEVYRFNHQNELPLDLVALDRSTGYFENMSEPARASTRSMLQYPVDLRPVRDRKGIATWKSTDGEIFVLLENGDIREGVAILDKGQSRNDAIAPSPAVTENVNRTGQP